MYYKHGNAIKICPANKSLQVFKLSPGMYLFFVNKDYVACIVQRGFDIKIVRTFPLDKLTFDTIDFVVSRNSMNYSKNQFYF